MAAVSGLALGALAAGSAFSAVNDWNTARQQRRAAERQARKQTTIQANANALQTTRDTAGAEFLIGTDDPLDDTRRGTRRTNIPRINAPSALGRRSASAAGGL